MHTRCSDYVVCLNIVAEHQDMHLSCCPFIYYIIHGRSEVFLRWVYMRENSTKYYVAENMWMIIDAFMTQKAGKYSQFVNSVTVTTLPCIIVTG